MKKLILNTEITTLKYFIPIFFLIINSNLSLEEYYINLITDGGPENKGHLQTYLNNPDIKINHLTAQKNFPFSNSQIEAFNKLVKYQQLHLQNIPDIQTLEKTLNRWIPHYNNERPNRAGKYLLTPLEIYNGKNVDKNDFSNKLKQAKKNRIAFNKQYSCGIC